MKILKFPEISDEWLDFIAQCRSGKTHNYDIVEGPMADDTVWNYVNDFLTGRKEAEELIKIFTSFISDEISDFNTDLYYQNPDYIECSYKEGKLLA